LKGNEQETLSTKGKWQTFHRNLRPINEKGISTEKQQEHFYLAGD